MLCFHASVFLYPRNKAIPAVLKSLVHATLYQSQGPRISYSSVASELSFYPLPDPTGPEAANNTDITQGQAPHPLSVEPWAGPHLWDEKLDRI